MVASAAVLHADRALSPDELIEQNLGFARSLVRRLSRRLPASVDVEELESDAYLGLMMAARTFDPDRGVIFRTYATTRIHGQRKPHGRNPTGTQLVVFAWIASFPGVSAAFVADRVL
jgi:DNA-directed RNA polymerase specialized sigma subunit